MVVWYDLRNEVTTGNDIFGQRVAGDGSLVGRNIPLVLEVDTQIGPSISHNALDNNYLVAWRQQPFDRSDPSYGDAFGQVVSNVGEPGAPFRISDAGYEISSVYSAQNHNYFVSGRILGSPTTAAVVGQFVSHDGVVLGDTIPIATVGFPAPNGTVVYNQTTGEYFATWRDQVDENLQGQRISSSGALLGDPIVISPIFPEFNRAASVAYDFINGRYLVIFVPFQGSRILGQFVSGAGELIGDNFTIAGLDSRETPTIIYSRRQRAYLMTWRYGENVRVQMLSSTGRKIGKPMFVTSGGTAAQNPVIVANSTTGEFLVAWTDNRDLAKGRRDIFAQRIAVERQ
jgi:hypothetical protein